MYIYYYNVFLFLFLFIARLLYNVQNQVHMQQQQTQVVHHTTKRGKVDGKPRGRMTAYAFFVQTCREEHKKKHPEESVIFAEFSRKCAERWKVSALINYI